MVKPEEARIEQAIQDFLAEYAFSLQALISALNDAHISHYSAGGGTKSITYDIFPASAYINEFVGMLTLERAHKVKANGGFKDAGSSDDSNPAHEFLLYLRRWSLFAEQVMQREGDNERGVSAAQAKLIMADLMKRLRPDLAIAKTDKKTNGNGKITDLFSLMRAIGLTLEARAKAEEAASKNGNQKSSEDNYLKALAAAQGLPFAQTPTRRMTAAA